MTYWTGRFLRSNEQQASRILAENEPLLSALEVSENVSRADFDCYLLEEYNYLDQLRKEPIKITLAIEYVTVLDKVWKKQSVPIFFRIFKLLTYSSLSQSDH